MYIHAQADNMMMTDCGSGFRSHSGEQHELRQASDSDYVDGHSDDLRQASMHRDRFRIV